jgi:DNA-binding NtrC family response regulator
MEQGWGGAGAPVEVDPEQRKSIKILVVDDERTLRESCSSILEAAGFPVLVAGKGDEALQHVRRRKPDIVLVDLYMPDISGMDILEEALRINPACLVIVMTGKASVESSIETLRAGAWNYIPKPFSATHLNIMVGRAAHAVIIARESQRQRAELETGSGHSEQIKLLGASKAFRKVIEQARQVAATDASVFLTGESGTGKELVAQFIHHNSRRSSREMVSVNSAAIPETLLESEMFGHVEGAFTGAVRDKKGLLEAANGGTLFLDEITEMPLSVQTKLLRVIQDGVVRRVGSISVDAVVDVRFIVATNQDPADAVRAGTFRKDLHYRLRVFPIEVPPLRARAEDIPVLAQHYLDHFWALHRGEGAGRPMLGEEAVAALQKRPWHGNVRELRNVMEHLVVVLPPEAAEVAAEVLPVFDDGDLGGGGGFSGSFPLHDDYHTARDRVLAAFEQAYLRHVVQESGGNLSDAARIAGVDRTTLYRLMEKHEIRKEELLRGDSG